LSLPVSFNCASGPGDPCIRAGGAASVEQCLRDLQHSVAVDDRAHVVAMVGLPIKSLWKASRGHCETKNQLLEYYNLAFDAKVRGFIAKQKVSELFCNLEGNHDRPWRNPD
jgi:hypothetical protein